MPQMPKGKDPYSRGKNNKKNQYANTAAARRRQADRGAPNRARPRHSPEAALRPAEGDVGPAGAYAFNDVAGKVDRPFDVRPSKKPLLGTPLNAAGRARTGLKPTDSTPQPEDTGLQDLFQQFLDSIKTDVGAGPNLQDYIGAIAPARENALKYQQAGTQQINAGTQALLAKLQATGGQAAKEVAGTNAAAQQRTAQVQNDQGAAALKAAGDLAAQGIATAPLQAQQQQLGGQLQSSANDQAAFAQKLAAIGQTEQADRAAGANTMGTGAVGQLGLNTQNQLNQLNLAEQQGRRQFGQDSAQHAAAAAAAHSNDLQQRFQLAQQFADLDAATEQNPTAAVRNKYAGLAGVQKTFDVLESGQMTPAQARVQLNKDKALAKANKDTDALAEASEIEKALSEWEKATHPDAKREAKKKQLALLSKYLTPHG